MYASQRLGSNVPANQPKSNFQISKVSLLRGKKYAARLQRQYVKVLDVATVARAGRHFVQAVTVNLDEMHISHETPLEFLPKEGGAITRGKVVGQDVENGILFVAFDFRSHKDGSAGKSKYRSRIFVEPAGECAWKIEI